MAFRASTVLLGKALQDFSEKARATKLFLQQQRSLMVQPTCSANIPLGVIQFSGRAHTEMTALASTPGLAAFARDQVNDQDYDIVAEATAMLGAIATLRDTLTSMFPKDANGFLLYQTLQTGGIVGVRTFTQAQLANAVSAVDAAIATIQ